MPSRRDFLRSAAALSGAAFAPGSIPEAIARAMAIAPAAGTTFLDAEHVVVLMQENRSFDHCYGALRGMRGFRDPRVHRQPDGTPVWFQTDARGATYAPFRLDIANTSATWLGGLPHTWPDQVDARSGGRYDKWLIAKPKRDLPFTLGHYQRDDLPFYYALADAFTVCDQAFCSSLTGTTANRLFHWTGTIRRDATDVPRVQNADTRYDAEASWGTFPERLEEAGVSWRIYQNEISVPSGLEGEADAWLANFTDNPIEWFSQFNVRFAPRRRAFVAKLVTELPAQIQAMEAAAEVPGLAAVEAEKHRRTVIDLRSQLQAARAEQALYHETAWNALSPRQRALHERAFTTNERDPQFRELATMSYRDGATSRDVQIPAGDTLFQFREDVTAGRLPAVSWIVAPQNFSDHPSAPWYGAWYVSEVLDILTENPEIWKKTIFVLCYDENDGYFDHVPPFVAPHPARPDTGAVSPGIDTSVEWGDVHGRDHAIGLGYRVPLVVASPWSRGGCVNSQVADHTSVLQLMETWLTARGTPVREHNISDWRRTVCGDLSSIFRPYNGESIPLPQPVERSASMARIHAARFQKRPDTPAVSAPETRLAALRTLQEPGNRPSCPLPYDLHVNAEREGDVLVIGMEVGTDAFGERSQGAPFNAYAYGSEMRSRSYAVRAGTMLHDRWPIEGACNLRVDGPNGFMRSFRDGPVPTDLQVTIQHRNGRRSDGKITVHLVNRGAAPLDVMIRDESYGAPRRQVTVKARGESSLTVATGTSWGWYDFTVSSGELAWRYAGRIETGKWSVSDPAM